MTLTQVARAEISGPEAWGLMQDGKVKESIAAFEKLSAKGDTKAMVQLGLFYHEGEGVKQDYRKAMDWYLKAFEKQNADALSNLGVMHRDGLGGVPKNKKMAYCVFLTIHMCGLGSQSTQMRANSCLRRLVSELSNDDIKDVLSNYTLSYMQAYIDARGKVKGIPAKYKPAKDNPALRDMDWWLDGELDAIYGPPSKKELAARKKKEEDRREAYESARHTLVFQVKYPGDELKYNSYTFITGMGLSSGPIKKEKLTKVAGGFVYEQQHSVLTSPKRFVSVEADRDICLIYEIKHPVQSRPANWSKWYAPDFALTDGMDKFGLPHGQTPKSKTDELPADAPKFRFKVVK